MVPDVKVVQMAYDLDLVHSERAEAWERGDQVEGTRTFVMFCERKFLCLHCSTEHLHISVQCYTHLFNSQGKNFKLTVQCKDIIV